MKTIKRLLLIAFWFSVFLLVFWAGTCYGNSIGYDRGFKDGKKTRIVYRCPNHDKTECEILGKRYEYQYLPNTPRDFFENGEAEYRYFSDESMDNYWYMNFFILIFNELRYFNKIL